jgi:hypothetical protein
MTTRFLAATRFLRLTLNAMIAAIVAAGPLLGGCSDGGGATDPVAVSEAPATPTPTPAATAAVPEPAPKPAPEPERTGTATASITTQPSGGDAAAPVGDAPQITFESVTHDFGTIPDTAKARATFAFTNTGGSKLIIESVKGSCGCTVPTLKRKEFMPGEGDEISVVFDPKGRPGTQSKSVTVTSNAVPEQTTTLRFTAQVEPLLQLEKRFIQLGKLPINTEHKKLLNATYIDPDLNFTNVSLNQPWGSARLLEYGNVVSAEGEPTKYGAVFELTVNDDAPWGTIYSARMNIQVSAKPEPEAAPVDFSYEVFLQGQLFGEIESYNKIGSRVTSPSSILSLGRVEVGRVMQKKMSLRRITETPFEILSAEVTETTLDGVTATVTKVNPSQYDIAIRAEDPTFKGLVRGIVTVTTDVEGEESLPIRFTGSFK